MKQTTIQGAIFDFNGTLFWDTDYHSQAFDVFIERYLDGTPDGYRSRHITPEEKRDHVMGQPNDRIMPYLFQRALTKEEINRFGEEKEVIYRELCRGKVELAPGCRDLFVALQKSDIPFTIASSADKGNIDFYYEQTDLGEWVPKASIVYNDGTIAHGKPAPDIFLKAAQKLGVPPAACAIFEDSASGIRAAELAGAAQIIVVNPEGKSSFCVHPVIDDFKRAIAILGL